MEVAEGLAARDPVPPALQRSAFEGAEELVDLTNRLGRKVGKSYLSEPLLSVPSCLRACRKYPSSGLLRAQVRRDGDGIELFAPQGFGKSGGALVTFGGECGIAGAGSGFGGPLGLSVSKKYEFHMP